MYIFHYYSFKPEQFRSFNLPEHLVIEWQTSMLEKLVSPLEVFLIPLNDDAGHTFHFPEIYFFQ